MKKTLLRASFATLATMCLPALAEPLTLTLPDNGKLTVDVPPMVKLAETANGPSYTYKASSFGSGEPHFNLSVFVEPKACNGASSHKEVLNCFIAKGKTSPTLEMEIKGSNCTEKYCLIVAGYKMRSNGARLPQIHSNLLYAYRGGWVDIHFSVTQPTPDDAKILQAFGMGVNYVD